MYPKASIRTCMRTTNLNLKMQKGSRVVQMIIAHKSFHIIYIFKRRDQKIKLRWQWNSVYFSSQGELLGWESSRRPWVRALTLSNINISSTKRPITSKFYLKHYWGERKAALGVGPDRIRTLVSMATNSSRRVLMGKILLAL